MRALIVGHGKMGKAVEEVLVGRGHDVVGRVRRGDSLEGLDPRAVDLAFEFTRGESAPGVVAELLSAHIPVVSGSTGWNPEVVKVAAERGRVPFLHTPNFSIGVAVMCHAVATAVRELTPFPEFEPGVMERHHSAKKDAPSGTAKLLADVISAARPDARVPIASLRHGGQPGEHTVYFEGRDEVIEIVHRARSRAIFAQGAVRAGEWLLSSGIRGPASFDDFLVMRRLERPRKGSPEKMDKVEKGGRSSASRARRKVTS